MQTQTVINFRLQAGLPQHIEQRVTAGLTGSLVARRDLGRYYALLDAALGTVHLSTAEAALVCDAVGSAAADQYAFVWAAVADGIRARGLEAKWSVDGAALIDRLRALSPGQALALADAVERFWVVSRQDGAESLEQHLERCGLRVPQHARPRLLDVPPGFGACGG
jgi:hypothetical protein